MITAKLCWKPVLKVSTIFALEWKSYCEPTDLKKQLISLRRCTSNQLLLAPILKLDLGSVEFSAMEEMKTLVSNLL